jgi:hypothetical protein
MDGASIEFLRDLLPVDDEEFRITSRGVIIPVALPAWAVNRGSIPTTETWLDKAEIEDASKHFGGYGIWTNATTLPDWVACKPVLMWETEHGLGLLDGRQRAAKRFAGGHKKVRARVIVKKDGRVVDLEGAANDLYPVNRLEKELLFFTSDGLLPSSLPDLGSLELSAALMEFPDSPAEGGAKRGGGKRPERPEWHHLWNLLLWSVYVTWVAKKVIRKRPGRNKTKYLQSDIAKTMLTIHKIDAKLIHDSMINSIKAIVGFDDALTYRRELERYCKNCSDTQIILYLHHIQKMANLEQRALAIIASYNRRLRRIRRLAKGRYGPYTPENLLKDDIIAIEEKYKTPIKLDNRYRLAKVTGVNITDFYWDPRWVRNLGRWWVHVYRLENHQASKAPSVAMADTFLQRLAMEKDKDIQPLVMERDEESNQLTREWKKLFRVLKYYNQLNLVEQQCWDVMEYKRP